ncbi:hypothetical protein H6G97_20640 [Nostoc flagelliforme FACHB-838]|uniref:5'-nucleotidase n=1 Tax=Nostoc flagelliforme FACHB-838 TaxID=2692904 RepID=A0ABR8DR15_9NOSO|nr:hypothetical protein [Nostoc flagelliforme]MBD2531861.1 hypothetical protein [Nostoc flagelliforme FACHB-838]
MDMSIYERYLRLSGILAKSISIYMTIILTNDDGIDAPGIRSERKSYSIEEAQGNIWIYMSNDETSLILEDIPRIPEFTDQSHQAVESIRFPCDLDHAVVELIDPAHIAFVHQGGGGVLLKH